MSEPVKIGLLRHARTRWNREHRIQGRQDSPLTEKGKARARKLGAIFLTFSQRMEEIIAAADLVVSMGGYNTVCEILSQKTLPLIIPRETPRKEQLIRARALSSHNLVDYIPAHELSAAALRGKVLALLENPAPYQRAMADFQLTGLATIRERISRFYSGEA